MAASAKRAEHVTIVALVLSVLFGVLTFLMQGFSSIPVVGSLMWVLGAVAIVSLILWMYFHLLSMAAQEKLDLEAMLAEKGDRGIFTQEEQQTGLLAVAQRRVDVFQKWFLPILAVLLAIYEVVLGVLLFRGAGPVDTEIVEQPLIVSVVMALFAFVLFLISRYSTGLSEEKQWQPLRALGSSLLGATLLIFAMSIALALANFQFFKMLDVMGWVVGGYLVVIGVESIINSVLDIYRPRVKGELGRTAFDSRLLGVINEPGGIFKSFAAAIDYQFGFQVSQTWFYKLIERAIVPLVFFSAVVLYAMSCVVVIGPNEQGIVEHLGNPFDAKYNVRFLESGLHFKLPWPFDQVRRYPTKEVQELFIGYVPKRDESGDIVQEPLLWGQSHYEEEYMLLVASESGQSAGPEAVPVSLVMANVPVHFRVNNLYYYLYTHQQPQKYLEALCYRELARYAAGSTIEVDEAGMERSLFGGGRMRAKQVLTERIQKAADEAKLGVEIVFVGVQGIHPPIEVAADYEKVVGAVQQKESLILLSDALRTNRLGSLSGSVEEADALYKLAVQYDEARTSGDLEEVERLGQQLDMAFSNASGDIYKALREASSYSFERSRLARATGERFAGQLQAYEAAPKIFRNEQYLNAHEEGLANARKYIIAADAKDAETFILDLQEKLTPSLYDVTGIDEETK